MSPSATALEQSLRSRTWERVKKGWYTFSKNPLSIVGAVIIVVVVFLAVTSDLLVTVISSPASICLYHKGITLPILSLKLPKRTTLHFVP